MNSLTLGFGVILFQWSSINDHCNQKILVFSARKYFKMLYRSGRKCIFKFTYSYLNKPRTQKDLGLWSLTICSCSELALCAKTHITKICTRCEKAVQNILNIIALMRLYPRYNIPCEQNVTFGAAHRYHSGNKHLLLYRKQFLLFSSKYFRQHETD